MKDSFDISLVLRRIRKAIRPYPKAALFELYDNGYISVFQILIACIISIRTYDETTIPCSHALFKRAATPKRMVKLSRNEIAELIRASTFAPAKAGQILEIAQRAVDEFGGEVPCDEEVLLSFRGVGPKCANLVLGIVCDASKIGVDIHVHRVTNRWGYIDAKTPEATMKVLMEILPKRYRIEINRLLVPFGKHICTGALPRCSTCPVLEMCEQVGVKKHR